MSEELTFNEYQEFTNSTAVYTGGSREGLYYTALGLAGEAGETADKIKKVMRDAGGEVSPEKAVDIAKELGDVLWYVSQLAREIGYDLNKVALMNKEKLLGRKARGTLKGSGDNR